MLVDNKIVVENDIVAQKILWSRQNIRHDLLTSSLLNIFFLIFEIFEFFEILMDRLDLRGLFPMLEQGCVF